MYIKHIIRACVCMNIVSVHWYSYYSSIKNKFIILIVFDSSHHRILRSALRVADVEQLKLLSHTHETAHTYITSIYWYRMMQILLTLSTWTYDDFR